MRRVLQVLLWRNQFGVRPLRVKTEMRESGSRKNQKSVRLSGRGVRFRRRTERIKHRLRLRHRPICFVFPKPQKEKRDSGGGREELSPAGNLGLGFPAEELGRQKEGEEGPDGERAEREENIHTPGSEGSKDGALQAGDEVSGRKKEANALDDLREIGKRNGRTGKENQRQPDELIDDLSFLHGIGDAGNDEAHGREGYRTNGDQKKC